MATKIELTLEYLIDNYSGDVRRGIDFAETRYPEYVTKPSKPILSNKPTSEEAFQYATKLKEYEVLFEKYKEEKESRDKKINEIDGIIEDFIKDAAGLSNVPEKYRDNVYSKAWCDGHSSGFYSVYQELCELCEIFE